MFDIANKTCTRAQVPCVHTDPSFFSSTRFALVISGLVDALVGLGTGSLTVRVVHTGPVSPRAFVTVTPLPLIPIPEMA